MFLRILLFQLLGGNRQVEWVLVPRGPLRRSLARLLWVPVQDLVALVIS